MKRTSIFILFNVLLAVASFAQNTLRIAAGERLDKEKKIVKPGGTLIMQSNGNLVLYAGGQPKWQTYTAGKTVTHAIMQSDGNFVLYNNTSPVWSSESWNLGAGGGYFEIDLNLFKVAIYKAGGAVAKVLQGGTGAPPPPPPPPPSDPIPSGPISPSSPTPLNSGGR